LESLVTLDILDILALSKLERDTNTTNFTVIERGKTFRLHVLILPILW